MAIKDAQVKNLEDWIEFDYNPFILFDREGKVIMINSEAQFLLGFVTSKEIFELATTYASASFGFKTTILDLEYGKYSFFAITVGYKDDDAIGIKLYKKPGSSFDFDEKDSTKINIYSIIDLAISSLSTTSKAEHKKLLDPTFPEIYLNLDKFLKLLAKIYGDFKNSSLITTKLSLTTGEYIIYKDKKYPIFSLSILGDKRDGSNDTYLKELAKSAHATIYQKEDQITLELPLISCKDT